MEKAKYWLLILALAGATFLLSDRLGQAMATNGELAAHYRACIGELERNNNELFIIREIYGELD